MCTFKWKYFKEEQDAKDWIIVSCTQKDFEYSYDLILKWAASCKGMMIPVNMRYCEKCNNLQIETISNSGSNRIKKIFNRIFNKDYRNFSDIRLKRENMIKSLLE